jgi:ABC-type nitrate/sulfonate/bicarbonate transport system substrate-binding protein
VRSLLCAALLVATVLIGRPATADEPKTLEVIVFAGGFNWPIWVAQDKGYLAQNHIAVHLTPTPGSVYQLTNLIDGKFDIAMTAIDNVIAYQEGQGEAPTEHKPNLVAFMGADNGFLRLVTLPEIKRYADLRGKELTVDARTTGYAFVLEKMLEKGGLGPNDYALVKAGGVLQRFEDLMAKKHAGTLLLSPFEVPAQNQGFNVLGSAIDVFGGHYQGLVGAARRDWAKQHKSEVVAYIRSYVAALTWLYDPANKAEAIAILRKNLPQMSPELAQRAYDILLAPKVGFEPKAAIDVRGIRAVLALRSEYGEPHKRLTNPAKYYDLRYYKSALAK